MYISGNEPSGKLWSLFLLIYLFVIQLFQYCKCNLVIYLILKFLGYNMIFTNRGRHNSHRDNSPP